MANSVPPKQAAEPAAASAAPVAPLKRTLPPDCIRENHSGMGWAEYLVVLPRGWGLSDLANPTIWGAIQSGIRGGNALRVLDALLIVDFNRTFFVEARVTGASASAVTLQITSRKDMEVRQEALPEIDDYRVAYHGLGYGIESKKTGELVGATTYATLAEARSVLFALVPRRVA